MSLLDTSGSTFYSEPHPETLGQQESPGSQFAHDSQTFASDSGLPQNSGQMPQIINPQYSRYSDSGVDTFAPSPVTDPTFQPATQQPAAIQATGFQFQPWMIVALGAAYVMLMRSYNK